ncbi:arylsulfatase [Zobellia amurskyensis]|uniref:Arylsulfatase n=2 Tax=Zobellia amurskyensis TaxID=248905 RepID=A0A7X2ZV81_9FLAO|nr:arylsulfatase [Zobellia amurskyensis]
MKFWSIGTLFAVATFWYSGNFIKNDISGQRQKLVQDKPNILWIVADDLGIDLGCYGNELIYTPNLDRLASEGARYSNMYTVSAVCSVSRSAMITGMYPVSIGCEQHRKQFKDSLPKPVKPITEYFKDAGYFVTNKGKTDYNFIHKKEDLYDGTEYKNRKVGQPFFSQIQISYPHRPFEADSIHPINPDHVKLPPYYPDHPLARKDWAMYLETVQHVDIQVGEILDELDKSGLSENTVVFFIGDQGRPMVRAKQFLYDAGIRTPFIVRWPGKIKGGVINDRLINNLDLAPTSLKIAGLPVPEYIQGQDFLDNNTIRKYVYSMRDRRDETVDRIRMVRSERYKYIKNFYTDRPYTQYNAYKKNFYPVLTLMQEMYKNGGLNEDQSRFFSDDRPSEEFYDLNNDPYELKNLANIELYDSQKNILKNQLDKWLIKTDLGTYPESPLEINYAKKLMESKFKENMEARGLSPDISNEEFLQYWEATLLGKNKN